MTLTAEGCSHRAAFAYGALDADVVADLRPVEDLEAGIPAPGVLTTGGLLPDPAGRRVTLDGFTLDPHTHRGGPPGGCTSVLTIEADDGWRARVVFEQYSGSRFAYDGLRSLMPLLWQAMSLRGSGWWRRDRAAAALPVLRAALMDPDDWFGPGSSRRDYSDTEWLVEWASCGIVNAALADRLFSHSVRALPQAGRKDSSLAEWRDSGIGDDAEIVDWIDLATTTLKVAQQAKALGFDPATYADWASLPLTSQQRPVDVLGGLRDVGWTPETIRELCWLMTEDDDYRHVSLSGLLSRWEWAMTPRRATDYIAAQIALEEAKGMEGSTVPPDAATLGMLAGLAVPRGRPTALLRTSRIGDLSRYRG